MKRWSYPLVTFDNVGMIGCKFFNDNENEYNATMVVNEIKK